MEEKVTYICNGDACSECHPEYCEHTTNAKYAKNFDHIDEHTYIEKSASPSYKAKVFHGQGKAFGYKPADQAFNEWVMEHPDIDILEFRYGQANYGDHSICILYLEKTE